MIQNGQCWSLSGPSLSMNHIVESHSRSHLTHEVLMKIQGAPDPEVILHAIAHVPDVEVIEPLR